MDKRYPALNMVASLLKTVSIIIAVIGVGGSIWFLFQGKLFGAAAQLVQVVSIVAILVSLVTSVIVYSLGDLFRCMMDIESNTRKKARTNGNTEEVEVPVPVRPRRNGSSGLTRILKVETAAAIEKRPAR